jgi:tyrosine-protein kinase Etk/Wzc
MTHVEGTPVTITITPTPSPTEPPLINNAGEIDLWVVLRLLLVHAKRIIGGALGAGVLALGITFLIPPTFTASTVILPPTQSSSSGLAMLAGQLGGALGGLGGLAGAAAGIKNPADQYVSMLKSHNVSDRLIDRFKLMEVYESKFRSDAWDELEHNTRISAGMKDGLITIEVDDHDPVRAADMANAYTDELRRMTTDFAVGEASQRRLFFEGQLKQVKDALTTAEKELGASGITDEALKAAPEAALSALAKLRARIAGTEIAIASLTGFVTEDHPDLKMARAELAALKAQEAQMRTAEASSTTTDDGYMSRYRDFKYNLALFEIIAQQYELARLDEAREGKAIQVIDIAIAPEKKSRPRRGLIGVVVTILATMGLSAWVVGSRLAGGLGLTGVPLSSSSKPQQE